jgi:hypothetical protein
MDSPWQSPRYSLEEGRNEFISALTGTYPLETVEKCVDIFIYENIDTGKRYPFESGMGFSWNFNSQLEEIEKIIALELTSNNNIH